jgi:hypothetical protein
MPGEADLRDEFLHGLTEERLEGLLRRALDIPAERPVKATRAMADSLKVLVETVWDAMTLAGEMGVLLKIERTLERAIERGKAEWEEKLPLFRIAEYGLTGAGPAVAGEELVKFVPGEGLDFWNKAERLVFKALEEYAAAAPGAGVARRRLFADDAAHGFALADLSSQKFDVVLMNPPFGAGSLKAKKEFERAYPKTKNDVYAAFVERGVEMLHAHARLGAITSRTGFFLTSFAPWREQILLAKAPPVVIADLGMGVLDAAMVETAAYCLERVEC